MKSIPKVFSNIFLISSFLFFTFGCGGASNNSNSTPVTCTSANPPVYTNNADGILNNNCVSCHANFATYSGAFGSASAIATQVSSGNMPKGGSLSQANRDILVQWGACGGKQ